MTFKELYDRCIDENGCPRNCGRAVCAELIDKCLEINPNGNFGDPKTGMMNLPEIRNLRKIIG